MYVDGKSGLRVERVSLRLKQVGRAAKRRPIGGWIS